MLNSNNQNTNIFTHLRVSTIDLSQTAHLPIYSYISFIWLFMRFINIFHGYSNKHSNLICIHWTSSIFHCQKIRAQIRRTLATNSDWREEGRKRKSSLSRFTNSVTPHNQFQSPRRATEAGGVGCYTCFRQSLRRSAKRNSSNRPQVIWQ